MFELRCRIIQVFLQMVEEQGQRCSPLLIAARNGKENVVKMLLGKFNPNIEQEGDVKFDGYVIEGASPLWCAAGIVSMFDLLLFLHHLLKHYRSWTPESCESFSSSWGRCQSCN